MRIASSAFAMLSTHTESISRSSQMQLNITVGAPSRSPAPQNPPPRITAAHSPVTSPPRNVKGSAQAAANDPKMALLRQLLEIITGYSIDTLSLADLGSAATQAVPNPVSATTANTASQPTPQQAPSAGFGLTLDAHTVVQESEQTHFQTQGVVRTADGQEIHFDLSLQMNRSYQASTDLSLTMGDAVQKDPLVINFGGTAAQLSSQRFSFDLNGDGTKENVAMLSGNSGYLALDLNQNGQIDSGKELFGPATGQGFAELSRYDQDGNGWIDEGDAVFKQLKVWKPATNGSGSMVSLKDSGVGALSLGYQATPFELKDSNNRSLGSVRSSGMYLMENGSVGSLQQIDLTV